MSFHLTKLLSPVPLFCILLTRTISKHAVAWVGSVQPECTFPFGTWKIRNFKAEFLLDKKRPLKQEKHTKQIGIHQPQITKPVEVNLCVLRGPLIWLTAAKNAKVSSLLNFRIRLRSGRGNRTRDLLLCNQSALRTAVILPHTRRPRDGQDGLWLGTKDIFVLNQRRPASIALLSWSSCTKEFTSKQQLDCSSYLSKFLVVKYFSTVKQEDRTKLVE